jgi:L-rhamnose mutarotase
MCNSCYSDRYGDDDDDGSNSSRDVIRSYNYKPTPKFFKVSDNDNVYLGIELEVERGDSSVRHDDMAKMIDNDFLYFKSDGSLSDGFEIVTHPMTISYIKKHKNVWADILNLLRSNKYRSYHTRTCGMHIHISKNAFTTWHLYRFMKFFVDNSDFVTKISQRKIENLDRWAALTDNPSESYKEFTQDRLMYKAKKKSGNDKRYLAVNLQNDNSVEIRIFRGTLNDSSFFKNIEFVQALFDYTKSITETDMSLKSFLSFIKDNNEYPYLRKFIADKNINPFLNQNKSN